VANYISSGRADFLRKLAGKLVQSIIVAGGDLGTNTMSGVFGNVNLDNEFDIESLDGELI
jgi:hypothetical protein